MTEEEILEYLKGLKLEIKEIPTPFLDSNCKRVEFKLVLARPTGSIILSQNNLDIFEGR